MKTFRQIGTEIGSLVAEKNAAYGSSFAKSGAYLRLLWPDGIPPDRYDDALLLVRGFDKDMRIATNKDAFGESPYQDKAGYGILGVHLHQQKKEDHTKCQGSASEDAGSQPKEQPASVVAPAKPQTMPNEKGILAHAQSLQQRSSSPAPESAAAPIATVPASPDEEGDRRKLFNRFHRCARFDCSKQLEPHTRWCAAVQTEIYLYCSHNCALQDTKELL